MSFTSEHFLAFIAIVALLYWIVPQRLRGWFLTICSYGFYFTWNVPMAAVLAALTLICYFGGLAIEKYSSERRKSQIAIGLTFALVGYIAFFKIIPLIQATKDFIIPLGISYYAFKLISYILDVYWGHIRAERGLGRFSAYIAFFPQIVAGPIQRADSFFEQMEKAKTPHLREITYGSSRILVGLFKKLFVADHLLAVVAPAFTSPETAAGWSSLLAFYFFTVQLYADFSALTDISNGTALFLGMEGAENFSYPFSAWSISEFWRRWHMSLTNWIRDYVFTPLRMALRNYGDTGLAASITVNMMLVALWHGFDWTFVVFGIIHSFFVTVDALTRSYRKRLYKKSAAMKRWAAILGPIVTYHIVAFGNTFWRARTVSDGWQIITGLAHGYGSPAKIDVHDLYLGMAGFLFIESIDYLRRKSWEEGKFAEAPRWARWLTYSGIACLYVFAGLFIYARNAPHSPFMYAGF